MRNNKGFSLVELIVVIAIMAILASVAVIGVSVYIPKAQQANDKQLAADIEYALELAVQAGELTPGDYVVIKADGAVAVFGNNNNNPDDTGATINAAMKAAFGENWATELSLSWDGWEDEIGVAGNAAAMEMVNNSNFTPDSLDSLLSQVQLVVDFAGGRLSNGGVAVSGEIAELMKQNGININEGDTLDETTGTAAANAYVYLVAGELSSIDLIDNDFSPTDVLFLNSWGADGNFVEDGDSWDPASKYAAEYAKTYALATYIDSRAGTDYAERMDAAGDPRNVGQQVLAEIKGSGDPAIQDAYDAYYDESNGEPQAFKDAVSFLTYMQGVSSTSDSLMSSTDLNNKGYFVDGYVANYVNNYISVSDVLLATGSTGNIFTFVYTGSEIVCMPLDY